MTAIEEWGIPLAVLGLVAALLMLAAINHRYQAYQAAVAVAVAQLVRRAGRLEDDLDALTSVPLSREMRLTLRSESAACWQQVRKLQRRYPEIAARMEYANAALQQEGPTPQTGVGPIASQRAFLDIVAAIDDLVDVMRHETTLRPIPSDVRQIFTRELGERRAEVHARHLMHESHRSQTEGDITAARRHLTNLMNVLRSKGPSTDFVRALYHEAEKALESPMAAADAPGTDPTESVA